jgi:predicted KAP-like P-loop ATPase
MKEEKNQSITDPITDPERFEDIFKEIIQKISKKHDKIVIIIDNIDRCHKDLAFELLLTIKNFLEQDLVVFIIPIDEIELKKHIEKE